MKALALQLIINKRLDSHKIYSLKEKESYVFASSTILLSYVHDFLFLTARIVK